jgi:hypothetical protein
MKTVLTKIEIPKTMTIDGGIENIASRLIVDNTTQGKITGAKIEMELAVNVVVNGVSIPFNSTISHTLTDFEMDSLMIEFNK